MFLSYFHGVETLSPFRTHCSKLALRNSPHGNATGNQPTLNMVIMKKCIAILSALMLVITSSVFAQNGEQLFKSNCGACHSIGKGKMTGPDLKNIGDRREGEWLVKWIKSSQELVKAGDPVAIEVFNANSKLVMPDQSINEEEIGAVLSYIQTKSSEVVAPPAVVPVVAAGPVVKENTGSLLAVMSFGEYLMLMLILFILIIVWALVRAIRTLSFQIKANRES